MKKIKEYKIDLNKSGQELIDEYIKTIKKLHKDLKELIIFAGIQEIKYKALLGNISKKSINHIINIYTFLIELKNNEYKNLKIVYNHLPSHAWDMYKLKGIEHMPEQILLKEAKKKVRDRWRERPKEKYDVE